MFNQIDCGGDVGPRFQNVIESSIHHFVEHELEAYFHFTNNAPGKRAFGPRERRMNPHRRELAGVILLHDNYSSLLDRNGKTIFH